MAGTKSMVIDFTSEGGVEAMHRENILDLGFLGKQEITRASDIKFDSATQTWGIWVADGQGGYHAPPKYADGFVGYEDARSVEIAWFERCRLHDWEPMSDDGKICLQALILGAVLAATM